MGSLLTAVLPAVIGGVTSLFSGSQAQSGAREQQATSARMAKEQMDFQERMSNTAEQRKVADLRAAGLNAGIAYGVSPASVPSGAMGQAQNVKGAGVSSAMAALQTAQQIASSRAQIDVARTQSALNSAAAAKAATEMSETSSRIRALYGTNVNQASFTDRLQEMTLASMRASLGLTTSQSRATSARATLDELDQARARSESKFYSGAGGKIAPWLRLVGEGAGVISPFTPKLSFQR